MKASYIASLVALLILLSIPAMAGTGTVIINSTGTVTFTNLNNFNINSVNATYFQNSKIIWVNVSNASDTISFTIYNFTASQVQELKKNSTPTNGYRTNGTGVLIFSITQLRGNWSYKLTPAVQQGGYNQTWGMFGTPLNNESLPASAANTTVINKFTQTQQIYPPANTDGMQISEANGAGYPAYSFITQSNTGMTSASANQLDLVAGGTSRLQVTTTGVIIVGTFTSTQTATNYTTTRTVDTVYQAPATTITVQVTLQSGGTCPVRVRVGSANPPTMTTAGMPTSAANVPKTATFTVLPSYYYTIAPITDCATPIIEGFYEYS